MLVQPNPSDSSLLWETALTRQSLLWETALIRHSVLRETIFTGRSVLIASNTSHSFPMGGSIY